MANLTELCRELRNWFDRGQPKLTGDWSIRDGAFVGAIPSIQTGQYFRIMGSVFNDGVHQYPTYDLRDEDFTGAIWLMAVPRELELLSEEIEKWKALYGDVEGQAMSPYTSESFGGYSYTKSSGAGGNGSGSGNGWKSVFADELNRYRKIL